MSLSRHISWTTISQVLRQLMQLALSAVLARLLTPEDFGLIGLTLIFTGFANLFSDLGLGAALIQRKEISREDLNFVFWLNLAVAMVVTTITFMSAPLVGSFYHQPRLVGIAMLLAFCPLLGSIGLVPGSILQKQARFKALAFIDTVSVLISGVIASLCAARGMGPLSLALQMLSLQFSISALRHVICGWRPGFQMKWRQGMHLLPFGSGLLGANLLNYWIRNGDNLIIGKVCGPVQLGFYVRGYALLMLPLNQVNSVLSPVLFPALSSKQDSKEDMRRLFLFANQAIAVLAFPAMFGLAVVADDFVAVLWGSRWMATVPIIRMLAMVGAWQSIGTTVGWIYMSVGRSDRMLLWTVVSAPFLLLSFLIGVRWQAVGVSAAYVVAGCILWYPLWRWAGSLIELSFRDAMINVRGPFLCSIAMVAGILITRMGLGTLVGHWLRLLTTAVVGAIIYIATLEKAQVPAYVHMKNRLLVRLSRRAAITANVNVG